MENVSSPPSALKSKVITFTRDISLTTDLVITGIGFKPSALVVFGCIDCSYVVTWGYAAQDKTAQGMCNYLNQTPSAWRDHSPFGANKVVAAYETSGGNNYFIMAVSTYDSDGVTLSCTKSGSPVGTLVMSILAFG